MKLTRFYHGGNLRQGIFIDEHVLLDVTQFGEDWNELFFGTNGIARLQAWLIDNRSGLDSYSLEDMKLAPAISRPSKLICIGLNYADHARETGVNPPAEPVVFMKATSAWCGPNDNLVIPKDSLKTDWEVELAVVIGKTARHVPEKLVLDYIAGYALHNDYSERAWQLEGTGQWVKGKSADTFAPFGPFLATQDEFEDVDNLRLWLTVNGEKTQDGNTSNLIFKIPHLVSYLSRFMTLLPGDVISTGTPAGVGLGFKPPRYLKAGDIVELGIDGLGTQRQVAVPWNQP